MRKRALALAAALVALLLIFYGAWPAWTGFTIRNAIHSGDAAGLAWKVDFGEVRASLRPFVRSEIERAHKEMRQEGGLLKRGLAATIKGATLVRLADAAIDRAVTPENVLRTARYGRSLRHMMARALGEELGASKDVAGAAGGEERRGFLLRLLGRYLRRGQRSEAATAEANGEAELSDVAAGTEAPRVLRKYTIANIKRLALTGPLTIEVGVNRDPGAPWSEVTFILAFRGDWRIVGVVPSLDR